MNEDLKKLLNHSVEYATELLEETGESYPFAAYIDTIGNVHPLEMEIDKNNVPRIGKVIEVLQNYCNTEMNEGRMKAFCISFETSVQLTENDKTDAICFQIKEKSNDINSNFYLPFTYIEKSKWLDEEGFKKAKVGEIFGVKS